MYQLRVTVTHRLGTFSGTFMDSMISQATFEEINQFVDGLGAKINGLERLSITADDGSEYVFGEEILKHSVLNFKVIEL